MNINELEELAKAQPKGRVKSDYLAAANPSAILELIAAYREAVDALGEIYSTNASKHGTTGMMVTRCMNIAGKALDTAKRIGV